MVTSLSPEAQSMIDAYKNLTIGSVSIPCLYYNNKKQHIRAGLRVSIGKGNPKDILDEIEILALKEKITLEELSEQDIRNFLQKHHIGVDCSAFAYYILEAEVHAKTGKKLSKVLSYPYTTNLLRKLLIKLRPVENTNVKTLAHNANSVEIDLIDVAPGDMITILEAGTNNQFYHIMIVHDVTYDTGDRPAIIHYTHSYAWSSDGTHHHGVRTGQIDLIDLTDSILNQRWIEREKEGDENETLKRAKEARSVELRRLHVLQAL